MNLGQLTPAQHEQEGQMIFLRSFNPTEMDKAVRAVMTHLKRYDFPGWDVFIDFHLMGISGGPVYDFLEAYIMVANSLGYPVTRENRETFQSALADTGDFEPQDIAIYLDAVLDARDGGTLPVAIYNPITYDPESAPEAGEGAVRAVTPLVTGTFTRVLLFATIGLVGYYAIPPVIAGLGKAMKSKRREPSPSLA